MRPACLSTYSFGFPAEGGHFGGIILGLFSRRQSDLADAPHGTAYRAVAHVEALRYLRASVAGQAKLHDPPRLWVQSPKQVRSALTEFRASCRTATKNKNAAAAQNPSFRKIEIAIKNLIRFQKAS